MNGVRTLVLLGSLGGILALGACSDSTSPGGDTLTAAEADAAASAQVDETEDLTDALALDGELGPAVRLAGTDGPSFNLLGPPNAECATVSSLTDTDNDGTPDHATFTYALPACHFTGYRGGTLDLTGQVTVSDPTPEAADFNRTVSLADFSFDFTSPTADRTFIAVRNGTRSLTGSASGITLTNNVTVERTRTGLPTATVVHNLQVTFTPVAGSDLAAGQPLPDGTISVSGSLTWSREGRSHVFTVTTVTPLQYDSSCAGPRRARISSGEIHWTLPSGRMIITTWTGCGELPTHQLVLPS